MSYFDELDNPLYNDPGATGTLTLPLNDVIIMLSADAVSGAGDKSVQAFDRNGKPYVLHAQEEKTLK